jgi:hypothetical protein
MTATALRTLAVCAAALAASCGSSSTARKGAAASEPTPECATMKEVCDDAYDFQSYYNSMPEQEREDMTAVLNTYVEHCEQARENCKRSKRGR